MKHFLLILLLAGILFSGCDETPTATQDSTAQTSSEAAIQEENSGPEMTVQISPSFDLDKELTNSDLYDISRERLREMRNEYYARRGYIFKSEDLREKFAEMGYPATEEDVSELLTDMDRANIQTIREMERYVTRTDQPLTIKSIDIGDDVSREFSSFLENLVSSSFHGEKYSLDSVLVEPSDVTAEMLERDLGSLQVSSETTNVTYSLDRCYDDCMNCREDLPMDASEEKYQLAIYWEYLEEDAGRDGSAIIYTFANVEDEYKVVCIFAAG